MKLYSLYEETDSSPYLISIKLALKEFTKEEGMATQIVLTDALQSAIIKQCSMYRRINYPDSSAYFSTNSLFLINCSDRNCHDDLMGLLKKFNELAPQIYDETIKGNYFISTQDKDKLEADLNKYFEYVILDNALSTNAPIAKKKNKI